MVSDRKRGLGVDVLTAARERISWTFDRFPRIYVSFSGGKDSTVMLHLVMDEAIVRGVKVGVLFVDLEGQYKLTIEHIQACYDQYAEHIEPYWVCLPLHLRNAVSTHQPHWICWDDAEMERWIRPLPAMAIHSDATFPFFQHGMEFEEFVPLFGRWFGSGQPTACFVGIRTDESLNRFRTITSTRKQTLEQKPWTTWLGDTLYNIYPVYDWRTEDLWTYHSRYPDLPSNALYERMHLAGLGIHQMRICQPYGDDQRKGLWLFHIIETETWGRVVARVEGANQGALYAQDTGNILGVGKITLPRGHTWESYAMLLLGTMPPVMAEHYRNKIAVFIRWWQVRGVDPMPDFADAKDEAAKDLPSWRRICKMLLRNDYWGKGLSFTQTKSEAYERYRKHMAIKRRTWGILG